MSDNKKNKLQEFCQKQKIGLPLYEQINNMYGFVSSVSLKFQGKDFICLGSPKNNKKNSEKSAAEKLLHKLDEFIIINKQKIVSVTPVYVLIDLENIHVKDFLDSYHFENIYFIGFSSKNYQVYTENMNIKVVDSLRRDAADILLTMYVAKLVLEKAGDIIVISKDHFGSAIEACVKSLDSEYMFEVNHVLSLDELIHLFFRMDINIHISS